MKWATCNVGATSPEEYGYHFAWDETSPKYSFTKDNSKTYDKHLSDIAGNARYDAARANWGGTWRLPTKAEAEELVNKCTWTWTTYNRKPGYKVTGPNGNSIFLPAAGSYYYTSLNYDGEWGCYWTSTPYEVYDNHSYVFYFCSSYFVSEYHEMDYKSRDFGYSIRPVME